MRILHAPSSVGGQAWGLSRAERRLGHLSDNVVFRSNKFGYKSDINLHLENKNFFTRQIKVLIFFLKSLFRYQVFHFYYANSLLPGNLDLPILKLFRKKIFFTFQGSDIRSKEAKLYKNNRVYVFKNRYSCDVISDKKKSKKINFINKYANKTFVLNPDLLLDSPSSKMLPYSSVDLNKLIPSGNEKNFSLGKEFIIVHAPTNRKFKGTKYIIKAVNKLKKDGYKVRLNILEGLSHEKAIAAFREADIAIDQLLIGWYGGFSIEMMALGKPVICYLDQRLYNFAPYYKKIPIINANKKTLFSVLRKILDHPEKIEKIGRESRRFVEEIHNSQNIAKEMIKIYKHGS